MGFWEVVFGRTRLRKPKKDPLFTLSSARYGLESDLGWRPAGRAGVCLKPPVSVDFEGVQREAEALLRSAAAEFESAVRSERDRYNFLWLIVGDEDFEDLVTLVHMVGHTLDEEGYGGQLLAAVFRFRSGVAERCYLIYSYKRGLFYPFVPSGRESRDNAQELRAAAFLGKELPLESDRTRWYPLWDCPV